MKILYAQTFFITLIEEDSYKYIFFASKVKNHQQIKEVLLQKGFSIPSDDLLYNPNSKHSDPISSLWYLSKCTN